MIWIPPVLNFLLGLLMFGLAKFVLSKSAEEDTQLGVMVFKGFGFINMLACVFGTIVAWNMVGVGI